MVVGGLIIPTMNEKALVMCAVLWYAHRPGRFKSLPINLCRCPLLLVESTTVTVMSMA